MKLINNIAALLLGVLLLGSCSDYLDVIPDNVPTIDHAFNNRVNAEKYLFTCYSYLPNPADPNNYPAFMSGGESWLSGGGRWYFGNNSENHYAFNIARGLQNSNDPLLNFWDGGNGGKNLFIAIRDCNIFLENIDQPRDIEPYEKTRWIAEVKFLKAYYHFFLLRMYGPIPIMDESIPVSSTPEEVRVYRDPVDEVGHYIVDLIDESYEDLALEIQNPIEEMGRVTQPIALAIKARTLTLLASPLFNGNPYYRNVIDNRGVNLFPGSEDRSKWNAAAVAIKEAIDNAHAAGHGLYEYQGFIPLSDSTKSKLNIRGAVTERWNKEVIWGSTRSSDFLQSVSAVRTQSDQATNPAISMMSPTLDVVERFYSSNGVPIDEDKEYDYSNRYKTGIAEAEERYFIKEGYETANLNFDREPRFYASLSFDGSVVYGNGLTTDDPDLAHFANMKRGQPGGIISGEKFSGTGYLTKKLVSPLTTMNGNNWSPSRYSFPSIRLADLYLLYAEALNETKPAPDQDVYFWVDEVRTRANLKGVQESWSNYSTRPDKVRTQSGMREIIHRERMNELAFEGAYYWDVLRWKEAEGLMKEPVRGWNVNGETVQDYYQVKVLDNPNFFPKDYLMPIKQSSLDVNANLVQNPGWGGN